MRRQRERQSESEVLKSNNGLPLKGKGSPGRGFLWGIMIGNMGLGIFWGGCLGVARFLMACASWAGSDPGNGSIKATANTSSLS